MPPRIGPRWGAGGCWSPDCHEQHISAFTQVVGLAASCARRALRATRACLRRPPGLGSVQLHNGSAVPAGSAALTLDAGPGYRHHALPGLHHRSHCQDVSQYPACPPILRAASRPLCSQRRACSTANVRAGPGMISRIQPLTAFRYDDYPPNRRRAR